ncbi:MAG: lysophospholipase [Saprospiraceae bacterium]|nr:lysophospholipase [Saprospiraceae bacterium]
MAEQIKNLTSKDGLSLQVREHIPPQYKGIVCIVHGFGEHGGRYTHVADFFNKNGYAVVAMDNRGHGKSGGKRGHAPRFECYLEDIDAFLTDTQQRLDKVPMFLYGHSMGGNLVLNYVISRQPTVLKGVVATGPWIRLAFEPKPIMITLGKIMRSIFPTFTQDSGLNADHISRDKSVVAAYKNDPLVHSKITAAAGMAMTDSAAFLNTYKKGMPIPTLILHGSGDLITSQPASETFSQRVSNTTYKKWEGLYHEIHNDPEKSEVLNYTLAWMNNQ